MRRSRRSGGKGPELKARMCASRARGAIKETQGRAGYAGRKRSLGGAQMGRDSATDREVDRR